MNEEPVVAMEGVAFRFGDAAPVLRDIDLRLAPGSFHFLSGPSGSGKTTLLRLMLLALRPSAGAVRVFGLDPRGRDALTAVRRRTGIVFQDFRLLEHLTVYQNVALPLVVQGYDERPFRSEVVDLLRWVGLGDRMDAPTATLSGGEKQRAAIARAVITHPDLVVADEPTGSVDPAMGRRLLHLFAELNRLGTSVVLATHDVALMDQVDAGRLILVDGRLWADP